MRFVTAFAFFTSGGIVYFLNERANGERRISGDFLLMLIAINLVLVLLTLTSSVGVSEIEGRQVLIESGLGGQDIELSRTPSIGSAIAFLVLTITVAVAMLAPEKAPIALRVAGVYAIIIGAAALLGHLIGIEALYTYSGAKQYGMALNSSALFVLLGYGMFLLSRRFAEGVVQNGVKRTVHGLHGWAGFR